MKVRQYIKKSGIVALSAVLLGSGVFQYNLTTVSAANFTGQLSNVESASVDSSDSNVVFVTFNDGVKGKITFLDNGLFRYNVDPTGQFGQYATPNNISHTARIQAQPDDSDKYLQPSAKVKEVNNAIEVSSEGVTIIFDKATAKMTVKNSNDDVVMEEASALTIGNQTTQQLKESSDEYFYGGGTQNGRFSHKGEKLNIANESGWNDGQVASPNPFYWSTKGYGVLRDTFKSGSYDFGKSTNGTVTTTHNESEFDAYYFVSDSTNNSKKAESLINGYYKVTGNPALLPEYAYYLAHLNCYNRDTWTGPVTSGGALLEDGKRYQEHGQDWQYVIPQGALTESLNNEAPTEQINNFKGIMNEDTYKFSARAVLDGYQDNDMPLGYFLPNDGYGCGYGQNGYDVKRDTSTPDQDKALREKALNANVANLKSFSDYANKNGVQTGLWTQSALNPDDAEKDSKYRGFQFLRDFNKEVNNGGIAALKTDVAWVSQGYSFGLNSVRTGYTTLANAGKRPNVISLDGWAGTQRYANIWTGDQYGGAWEYIRFHIPTYIGQSLSGNPNIGSDINGIFGGGALIQTRDIQWKTFTQTMLDMDGWGSEAKKPYTHGDPYNAINRLYLKMKAELMPYLYNEGITSVTGLPAIRAMFLEFPEDPLTYGKDVQYQYMYGSNFLVAPVYEDVHADAAGNDVRNGIYLPGDKNQIWVDYFTGKQYTGGKTLNNFDAPVWKLPLFVKNGAIVPMYEENNNPSAVTKENPTGLDKAKRVVEFWPAGTSSYELKEDDGISLEFQDNGEKDRDVVDYGKRVTTTFNSKVEESTATLTAGKSEGSYDTYNNNRKTTFVVNVAKKPTAITATNGATSLTVTEATTLEEYNTLSKEDNKTVYFYDAAPNLNKYSQTGEGFKDTAITTTPKLYVKFAKTDVQANEQKLVITGFSNDQVIDKEEENAALAVPTLSSVEDAFTPTSITLAWNKVDSATSYDLEVDGTVNNLGVDVNGEAVTGFVHKGLAYNSTHKYRVRSRNADGYSVWSDVHSATSLLDPWRNVPTVKASWNGGYYAGRTEKLATDHILQQDDAGFHSDGGAVSNKNSLIYDLSMMYKLDKMEYYPRVGTSGVAGGNGTVQKMKIEISKDGKNWKVFEDGTHANKFADKGIDKQTCQTYDFSGITARYVRMTPIQSTGGFFSAREIAVYKQDGSIGIPVGSNNGSADIDSNSITQIKAYAGSFEGDSAWGQVKDADLNYNNVYDVYDMAYTLFKMDGGTKKTGNVAGDLLMIPNKTTVKAGETFTIDLYGVNMKNVNGLGGVYEYDASKYEFVNFNQNASVAQMDNYTADVNKGGNTRLLTVTLLNRGDKAVVSGSKTVGTITMKAKEAGNVYEPSKAMLIGPTFTTVETDVNNSGEIPDIPLTKTTRYAQKDMDITITNNDHPTDDGKNVNLIVQQNSYDGLFDGSNSYDSTNFELKWNNTDATLGLPVTLHFNFAAGKAMTNAVIWNRNDGTVAGGNGVIKDATAVVTYEDDTKVTTSFKGGETSSTALIKFDIPLNKDKKVKNIDFTMESSYSGNLMFTLCEAIFTNTVTEVVESIVLDKNNASEMNVGQIVPFNASIAPAGISNPYYLVESENKDIAEVLRIFNGTSFNYYIKGIKAGPAMIKVTSAGDPTKFIETAVLVKAGVDNSELQATYNKYKDEVETKYTADSWKVFRAALTAASTVLADNTATQDTIDKANTDLQTAATALITRGDISALAEKVTAITNENLKENEYTAESWSVFKTALDAAKAMVADNSNAAQSDVDAALSALTQARAALAKKNEDTTLAKSILKSAIDKASAAEASEEFKTLAPSVKALIISMHTAAQAVYDNAAATNAQCIDAWINLANALQFLDFQANKAALLTLIKTCNEINTDGYTGGVEEFKAALVNAQSVYDNPNALQESINDAYDRLDMAKNGLVKEEVDKSFLENMVSSIEQKVGDGSKYKQDANWTTFTQALANAQAVLANEAATQADVNAATSALSEAYMAIRLLPSEEQLAELNSFLAAVNGINRRNFTSAQLAVIDGTVEKVKEMINDFDETQFASTQTEMAKSLGIINDVTAKTPSKPGNSGTSGSANAAQPNTGDNTNVGALAFAILVSGCGVALIRKRRNKKA